MEEAINENISIQLDNHSSGTMYKYKDDNTSVYISNIQVDSEYQGKGLGNKLLTMFEIFAKSLGATDSYLWVGKDTWMYEWYKRKGYADFEEHENIGFIWMKKELQYDIE